MRRLYFVGRACQHQEQLGHRRRHGTGLGSIDEERLGRIRRGETRGGRGEAFGAPGYRGCWETQAQAEPHLLESHKDGRRQVVQVDVVAPQAVLKGMQRRLQRSLFGDGRRV